MTPFPAIMRGRLPPEDQVPTLISKNNALFVRIATQQKLFTYSFFQTRVCPAFASPEPE